MPKLFLLLLMLAVVFEVKAQKPAIRFDSLTISCDTIRSNKTSSGDFNFTNTGQAPLVIENVQSASGDCTAMFSQEPIMPGKKGKITYYTHPTGSSRKVIRYLTVKTNASEKMITLKIIGYLLNP